MAAFYPAKTNLNRTSSYPHFDTELKYDGINFPINLHDISKFEKLNNLSVNVYGIESDENSRRKEIVPLYSSQFKSNKRTIHLLMIGNTVYDFDEEDDKSNPVYHFALIKNLSRLVRSQISKSEHKSRFCDRCLCHFRHEKSFNNHRIDCENVNKCIAILPEDKDKVLKFKNQV